MSMLRASHKLKSWRRSLFLTQEQAAARFDVSRKTWIMWERGEAMPGPASMVAIYEETAGLVVPNDWYVLPELTAFERKAS